MLSKPVQSITKFSEQVSKLKVPTQAIPWISKFWSVSLCKVGKENRWVGRVSNTDLGALSPYLLGNGTIK